MLPAATEIVGALGLMDHLVGVSHECDYPEEANQRPRITHCEIYGQGLSAAAIDEWVSERLRSGSSLYTLDEQTLRALAPDLILTQRLCDVCAPAYDSVEAMARTLPSKPRVLSLEPTCLGDILDNVAAVACAMEHPDRGAALCRRLEGRIAEVHNAGAGLQPRTTFMMEWTEPIFNSGHWNPELIELAGGKPVLSPAREHSVRIPWEDLRTADPEVLVIACCGHKVERTLEDMPILEALPGWHRLQAVRNRRIFVADGSAYFSRPGPRIIDSLEMLVSMIHPEVPRPTDQVVRAY
jgi:iron complex transport system substrate-binding protein